MTLPRPLLERPVAHRALHDAGAGRPENSRAALRAAMEAGYPVEIDVQLSADGEAMVFHDHDLGRLTAERGPVRQRTAAELGRIRLAGCDETIPTLAEMLEIGRGTAFLVEIKDQDGALGPDVGRLEEAVARALRDGGAEAAVMSFNPHSVAAMAELSPDVPRGLVTGAFRAEDWPTLPAAVRDRLRGIPDYDRTGACFVSHEAADLGCPRLAELRAAGAAILCWTIRSAQAEAKARRMADNVTFEGYRA